MLIRQLFDPTSSTYTYLVADARSREALIIDSVFERHQRDAALVRELGLELVGALETHVHADHVSGAWLMNQAFGAKIIGSARGGAVGADRLVDDGDHIRAGRLVLEVRATPGHTNGCVTYVRADHKMAFTGDALMIRGAGRTDFQQGSAARLYASITQQVFSLPDDCLLYPGHDYGGRTVTTVAEERRHNPRVGGGASETDFVGFMDNLGLPHPKKMDIAVPANLGFGRPESGQVPGGSDWAPVVTSFAGMPELDPSWVAEHLDEVTMLDVRARSEFEGELGHIEGAILLPLGELRQRIDEVSSERPVVAVCRSGRRSGQATSILRKAGRDRVANLTGGMIQWAALGLPVG